MRYQAVIHAGQEVVLDKGVAEQLRKASPAPSKFKAEEGQRPDGQKGIETSRLDKVQVRGGAVLLIMEGRTAILHTSARPEPLMQQAWSNLAAQSNTSVSRMSTDLASCACRQGQLSWGSCSI